jgi:hypothetical protein
MQSLMGGILEDAPPIAQFEQKLEFLQGKLHMRISQGKTKA